MLLMTTNLINPLWCVIGCMVMVGVACIAYRYFNPPTPPIDNTKRIKSEKLINGDNSLVEQLSPILKHFSGSMNALQDIITDADIVFANVTFENVCQIIDAHGNERVKQWFSVLSNDRNRWDKGLYKDRATEMLKLLKSCGISQSKERELQWNEEAAKRYRRLSKIETGQQCKVVAPYWIYENDIFEKGLVEPK